MGFFQNDKGDMSMARLLAFMGTCACIIFGGIGCLKFIFVPSGEALAVIVSSIGGLAGAQAFKNTGRKLENGQ